MRHRAYFAAWMLCLGAVLGGSACAQSTRVSSAPQKVFLDTDIGDDVDDAFALALALNSPEMEIVGISGAWGETALRARMVARFLQETGHAGIPVGAGVATKSTTTFTQRAWAEGAATKGPFPDGVQLLRDAILKYPGELTLVAIGPLTDIGALIDRDAATFRKLKRVVIMGGSVYKGYEGAEPSAEYNIQMDIHAAQKLFTSGVPISVLPLDSTVVQMSQERRAALYAQDTQQAKMLQELDREWVVNQSRPIPTLFDVVAVAVVIDPKVCPVTPLHLVVDSKAFTRPVPGKSNADVCLKLDEEKFFQLYYGRLMAHP